MDLTSASWNRVTSWLQGLERLRRVVLARGGPMALPSGSYAPRDPVASVLYQVVRDHYHTFRAEASQLREGEGLPRFVDDGFDAFLRCGWHAGGFARFRCTGCRAERLVAFSCKGRGFCPSCGGRRMPPSREALRRASLQHRRKRDGTCGAPRGPRPARGAHPAVGVDPAPARPLRLGVAPRLVHGGGWRAVPRGSAPPADVGADAPSRRRTKRGHHRGPAIPTPLRAVRAAGAPVSAEHSI